MTGMQTATEKANAEAKSSIEQGNQVARVRADQNELINAFRAKHGLEPDDCCVDIRRLPNNRLIWDVRKMTVSEREAQRQLAIKREVEATKQASERTYVWAVVPKDYWFNKLGAVFFSSARVHLTEKGANESKGQGEDVVRLEVRA